MEDTKTNSTSSSSCCRVANYDVHWPSHFLKEAVNAILKCLGFESKPYHDHHHGDEDTNKSSSSSSKEQDKNKNKKFIKEQSCSHDDDQESSSYATLADPPSTTTTTTDSAMEADLARRGNTPPRPRISGGRDPQTNSNRSS